MCNFCPDCGHQITTAKDNDDHGSNIWQEKLDQLELEDGSAADIKKVKQIINKIPKEHRP